MQPEPLALVRCFLVALGEPAALPAASPVEVPVQAGIQRDPLGIARDQIELGVVGLWEASFRESHLSLQGPVLPFAPDGQAGVEAAERSVAGALALYEVEPVAVAEGFEQGAGLVARVGGLPVEGATNLLGLSSKTSRLGEAPAKCPGILHRQRSPKQTQLWPSQLQAGHEEQRMLRFVGFAVDLQKNACLSPVQDAGGPRSVDQRR